MADGGVTRQAAGMSGHDWRANLAAKFHPVGASGRPRRSRRSRWPAHLVFVYVRDGTLHVSIDLEEAGAFFADPVPVQVTVQGQAVFEGR
jgi:hypothetical protein